MLIKLPRENITVGTWNVRALNQGGKPKELTGTGRASPRPSATVPPADPVSGRLSVQVCYFWVFQLFKDEVESWAAILRVLLHWHG